MAGGKQGTDYAAGCEVNEIGGVEVVKPEWGAEERFDAFEEVSAWYAVRGHYVEEEVVEQAMDKVETEEEVVANNNAESSEQELSLKDKFKQAFSEDNLTINY